MSAIGLVGTSGVGKTTLAQKVSEVTGVPFISSQVRSVYKMYDADPSKHYDFDTKMTIQQKLLEFAELEYRGAGSLFISDRTPIDFAAHMISDVRTDSLNIRQTEELLAYIDRCYRITNLYFASLILVQPGIQFEHRSMRPSNEAHLEHLNLVMTGMIADADGKIHSAKHTLSRSMLDLDKRVESVIKIACLVERLNMRDRLAVGELH